MNFSIHSDILNYFDKKTGTWKKTNLGEAENWVKFKHFVEGSWRPWIPEEIESYYSGMTNKDGYILDQSGKETGYKVNKNIFGSGYDIDRFKLVKHPDTGEMLLAPRMFTKEDWNDPKKVKKLVGIVVVPVVNQKTKKGLIDHGMPEDMAEARSIEYRGYVSTYHQFRNDQRDAQKLKTLIIMEAIGGIIHMEKHVSKNKNSITNQITDLEKKREDNAKKIQLFNTHIAKLEDAFKGKPKESDKYRGGEDGEPLKRWNELTKNINDLKDKNKANLNKIEKLKNQRGITAEEKAVYEAEYREKVLGVLKAELKGPARLIRSPSPTPRICRSPRRRTRSPRRGPRPSSPSTPRTGSWVRGRSSR